MKGYLLAIITLFLLIAFKVPKHDPIVWKNNARAAICLTYDDGMHTHLKNAIPQLNEAGFKGTFIINSIAGTESIIGWKKAAKDGHELGNHSLFHPCPEAFGWPEPLNSDHYTIPQILQEIKAVNEILTCVDSVHNRAYGYPCNQTEVGGKSYIDTLRKSGLIRYARSGSGEVQIILDDFSEFDPMNVPSWAVPEDVSLQALIDYAEEARKRGGLAVIQFHGVGGEWIHVSNETHQAFLKYLSDNRSDYWVATFSEAVAYVESSLD